MGLTPIDALISLAIAYVFVRPGFNQWPQEHCSHCAGQPKNYLSSARYFLFCAIYVFSFLIFAYALRQLGLLAMLLGRLPASDLVGASFPSQNFLHRVFADYTLSLASAGMVSGIRLIPQLGKLDDRWRGYLLTQARAPKDALDIKQRILAGLQQRLPQGEPMEALISQLKSCDTFGYWWEFDSQNPASGILNELKSVILKNLYLIQANRSFNLNASDSQDLITAEERVAGIDVLLPSIDLASAEILFQYKIELEKSLGALAEMLARNTVRTHSEHTIQLAKMQFLGLEMGYVDQHGLKLKMLKPARVIIPGLLMIHLLVVSFGLLLFDGFKVTPPLHTEAWFDIPHMLHWSLDSWIGLGIAIFFGGFFHETLVKRSAAAAPFAYFLAFFFATLGSGLYFSDSEIHFSATHIWLSISFGFMALITVKCGAITMSSSREAKMKANRIALVYAFAAAVSQMPLIIILQGSETLAVKDALAWFVLGFAKGYFAAFLVTYTLLNYRARQSFEGRRKSPRIPYHKPITGQLNNVQTEMLIKDISSGGALVQFQGGQMPIAGQALVLQFDFSPIPCVVIWAKDSEARLRFDTAAAGISQLQTELENSTPADYLMVMAA